MKKIRNGVIFTICLMLYLNIGWALGTYWNRVSTYEKPHNIVETFMQGGGKNWYCDAQSNPNCANPNDELANKVLSMFIWPIILVFFIGGSWIVWLFYKGLWLIFAGGLAKLFGIG